jgi:dTDP-N-acetylfucosamine:lipid II N-acetylfucosaminyltransferase
MILHILSPLLDKFTLPFIKFMDDNKEQVEGEHKYLFICRTDQVEGGKKGNESASFLNGNVDFMHPDADDAMSHILQLMLDSEKIIIHGLWREKINDILVANPELFKKVYWVLYGGDYYHRENYSKNHIKVIQNAEFIMTCFTADFNLIKKMYGAKGKQLHSFVYTSNLCQPIEFEKFERSNLNILLGHSGIKENQHLKYLEFLSKFKEKFTIFCPLSYPNKNCYIENVIHYGKKLFGERFIPLLDFIPKGEYEVFLAEKIDIAICASWRMHGVGNITTLLSAGAKVYIDESTTTWECLSNIGIKLFSLKELESTPIGHHLTKVDSELAIKNSRITLDYFSEKQLLKSLNNIWSQH